MSCVKVGMPVSIPAFELVKLEPRKGKREKWHSRYFVVVTVSGQLYRVGSFVYKKTAIRAIEGASKSGRRLVETFLRSDGEKSERARICLQRYFLAHKAKEGFDPPNRLIPRYSDLRYCKK